MRKILVAGAAALALAGATGLARAQSADTHVMTVRLPDGQIGQIRYTGNVPPQIVMAPAPVAFASPFAMLERMSAIMDHEMAAMFQGMPGDPAPVPATQAVPPAGMQSYRMISTLSGSGVCTQTTRITFTGNGQPNVEQHSQGNCGSPAGAPVAVPSPAPENAPAVKTIEVKAPPSAVIRPATSWRG